jgi:recombination protein RecA
MDALLISQPDCGEEALEIASMLVHTAGVGIVVIDSVAAFVPKSELEGGMGDAFAGLQARLMSQALRKLAGAINKSHTTVVFVNQLREEVGVMYGNREITTGGRTLKFYASLRFEIRRVETLKEGEQPIGQRVRVKVAKNKLAAPFRKARIDILFGRGIDLVGSIIDAAIAAQVLTRSGAWITYQGKQLGHGRDAAREALIQNHALASEIEQQVRHSGTTAFQHPPSAENKVRA